MTNPHDRNENPAEWLAHEALAAADGDYSKAVDHVASAARVLMHWHFLAVFCEPWTGEADG